MALEEETVNIDAKVETYSFHYNEDSTYYLTECLFSGNCNKVVNLLENIIPDYYKRDLEETF